MKKQRRENIRFVKMNTKEKIERNIISTSRIQALVDAVFAIAMTLLVLNIDVPDLSSINANQLLGEKIAGMMPYFYNFILSFVLLGIFWINHHKQFLVIKKSNEKLLWINLFLLLSVVIVPFSSELAGDYGQTRVAALFFNANLFVISVIYLWQWIYATENHRLISNDVPASYIRNVSIKNIIFPSIALCAIIVGLFYPENSFYLYITIPIIMYVYDVKYKQ